VTVRNVQFTIVGANRIIQIAIVLLVTKCSNLLIERWCIYYVLCTSTSSVESCFGQASLYIVDVSHQRC